MVTPTGADTGTIQVNSLSPLVNFFTTGSVLINLFGGDNDLTVNGTTDADMITGSAVAVASFKTIDYSNVQNLNVLASSGDDTIDVTPSAVTSIFIDGGDPIGSMPGDVVILNPPARFT